MSDADDANLSELLREDSVSSEQREFDELSSNAKLQRLNHLIQQTEVYSQIILDNMLEKSLEKKKLQKRQEKLKKRELRREAKAKHEEQKKIAAAEGKPEPKVPDILMSDSESNSEPEEEQPPTPKLDEPGDPEDSDLEIVEVKDSKKRKGSNKRGRPAKIQKPTETSSQKTRDTRKAIESAQTAHGQLQPSLVTGCEMKDYQLDGLEWLITLYENGLNGILADEMGLGKTLQCISLICHLLEHKVRGPFLIVAPLSTVNNWCEEFKKFAPSVRVVKYTGPKEERQKIPFSTKKLRGKVIVTSYEIVIRDFSKVSRTSWSYLTVDEGHRLKNFECLLIQKLKRVDAANRLLLTGTPLQNNLNELWSLLNFILPDIFGDLELFQLWFNFEEFTTGNQENDSLFQEDVKKKLVKSLHSILKPFLLRRLKVNAIKTLPPKKEYIVYADLTPVQEAFYLGIAHGDAKLATMELYAKELLLKNHPEKFTKPEHLDPVNEILRQAPAKERDILEEADGRVMRRDRKQVYNRKVLKDFENGKLDVLDYASDTVESGSESDEEEKDGKDEFHDASEAQNGASEADVSQNGEAELNEENKNFEADLQDKKEQDGDPEPGNSHDGENGHKTVVTASLGSEEKLEGEALQREVERQTEELERTLMMSMDADTSENIAKDGAALEFHPKDQEVLRVNTTAREWIPYRTLASNQNEIVLKKAKNGSLKSKIQKTIHDIIQDTDSSEGDSDVPPQKRRRIPTRGRRRRKRHEIIYDELDIEVIEIKDDSELTEDEKRRALCQEVIEIAKRYAVHLHLQNTVMQLRKVCGSHYTFFEPYVVHDELDEFDMNAVREFLTKIVRHSGKIQVFEQLLDKLMVDGHKVLVFSQFQKMLDVLEIVLTNKGIPFNRLDGSTKQDEREDAMNEFKENGDDSSKVFLLSTRAGGLGLNLVSADTVILFDNDWNPQMDLQAIDRLHRIGQTNPVKIFRLVVRNTIEELLIVKSFSKRLLERMVIQLGQFLLGKVAQKLAEENIDLEKFTSRNSLLNIGNRLDLLGSHEDEFDMKNTSKFLLAPPTSHETLTNEEMNELMDRSKECYNRNPLDTKFANVTPFESTNSVEE